MNLFQIASHYFWVVGLALCGFQFIRSTMRASRNSYDLATAQSILFYQRIWFGAQAVPWVIMGFGILTNAVPDLWAFLRPQEANPVVLAFIASAGAIAIGFAWWAFSGGAKTAVDLKLPEILGARNGQTSERGIKLLSAAGVVGVPAWVLGCMLMGSGNRSPFSVFMAAPSSGQSISADGYRMVFDLARDGFTAWTFSAFGLIFVVIGIVLVIFRKDIPYRGPEWMRRKFPYIWLGFAVIWTMVAFVGTYSSYRRLANALNEGNARTVVGEVSNFVPMPVGGHAREKFCVQQVCFQYSDFIISGGFNNTSSHGGPIKDGLPVRVTYVGDTIVRLEVGTSIRPSFTAPKDPNADAASIGAVKGAPASSHVPDDAPIIEAGTPQAWALATDAMLTVDSRMRHDLLAGWQRVPDVQANFKRILSDSWGIENRSDLLQTLTRLEEHGHREEFQRLGRLDALLDEHHFIDAFFEARFDDLRDGRRLKFAHTYYKALGAKSLLAFDLVRAINLSRWGYLVGYVSEDEAWHHIMFSAEVLRMTYPSWQDLSDNYLLGREFWGGDQKGNARMQMISRKLLTDPKSPWLVNRWETDLH